MTTEYRVNKGELPDVQSITKKMAIVAWQPGPNRVLMVPQEVWNNSAKATMCRCAILFTKLMCALLTLYCDLYF